MIFRDQVAIRLIVRGPNGEIIITVENSNPTIQFRADPSSPNPDASIFYSQSFGNLVIETNYMRMGFGTLGDTQPAWYVRVQGARGIILDDTDLWLKTTDGNVVSTNPEPWRNITVFANGWTAGVPAPQCYRDPTGQAHLRGRLVPGVTANGTVMCTLPSTHRPPQTYFVPITQDNAPYNQPAAEVQTDGDVTIWSWTAGIVVLDAVKFHLF